MIFMNRSEGMILEIFNDYSYQKLLLELDQRDKRRVYSNLAPTFKNAL